MNKYPEKGRQRDKEMSKEAKQERRKEVLVDLMAIWLSPTEEGARQKFAEFVAKWEGKEPLAVARLREGFDATLTYYQVQAEARRMGQEWDARYLRTTSPLERVNRTIRAKLRSSTIFQTARGLRAAVFLTVGCRGKSNGRELRTWLTELAHRPVAPVAPCHATA